MTIAIYIVKLCRHMNELKARYTELSRQLEMYRERESLLQQQLAEARPCVTSTIDTM